MLCIKDIKVVEVPEDYSEFRRINQPHFPVIRKEGDDIPKEYVEVAREMVYGHRFRNAYGKEVCIGMTKDVQDLIGVPLRSFDNMRKEIKEKSKMSTFYEERIAKFNTAGFFKKLKIVFTGKEV